MEKEGSIGVRRNDSSLKLGAAYEHKALCGKTKTLKTTSQGFAIY
jgi:hypothetical protein